MTLTASKGQSGFYPRRAITDFDSPSNSAIQQHRRHGGAHLRDDFGNGLGHADDTASTVAALSAFPEVWGDNLPHNAQWQARVAHWLEFIKAKGMLLALSAFNVSYRNIIA